jgi:hypothetical protein
LVGAAPSLKKSRAKEVMKALEKHNPEWAEESDHPVAIAIKYLGKLEEKGQLDYAAAIEENLSIWIRRSGKCPSPYSPKASQNPRSLVAPRTS